MSIGSFRNADIGRICQIREAGKVRLVSFFFMITYTELKQVEIEFFL
jgi:hypothetical protein